MDLSFLGPCLLSFSPTGVEYTRLFLMRVLLPSPEGVFYSPAGALVLFSPSGVVLVSLSFLKVFSFLHKEPHTCDRLFE